MANTSKPILVIGGGIAGMTAAVDAAEVGYDVILVEKEPYLGGRVIQMHRYFPKMCPPTCGFEINIRRIKQNPRITIHTHTTIEEISGPPGSYRVQIKKKPSYVVDNHLLDESNAQELSSERKNDFNYGMDSTKALYVPHDTAYPFKWLLDRQALSESDQKKITDSFPKDAINLSMVEEKKTIEVGAVIVATGWHPYDAMKLDNLGFGSCKNIITNVMMERLASGQGPTSGEIKRPSDGKKANNIAFVQCAGSRDENHLPYCSAVCCMGTLKQARYIREKDENAHITIFYIDIRTIGREEKFYFDLLDDENINFIKGKVASISEDSRTGNLTLDVEDTISREKLHKDFDLVVLATGLVPNTPTEKNPLHLHYDEYGFIDGAYETEGVYAAGCAKRPCDVSRTTKDSTGAALKAIQFLNRED